MTFQNLNKKIQRIDRFKSRSIGKKFSRKFFTYLLVFMLIIFLVTYFPARGIYSSLTGLKQDVKNLSVSTKQENLDQIKIDLIKVKSSLNKLNSSLGFLFWVRFIPYFGYFYSDAVSFSKAGIYEVEALLDIVSILEPYKNELGLTGGSIPGNDRVTQFVKIMDKVIPHLSKIEPSLEKAAKAVEAIDIEKYPSDKKFKNIKNYVMLAKNGITGAYFAVSQARPAIEIAPSALGQPNPKNYLIIFQNDKELRATGGFMTAYAFIKLDKGRLSSSASDDIYRLDEKLLNICKAKICSLTPPKPIVKYLPEVSGKPRTAWSMRDSNISPDLPTSMKEFERMYEMLGEGLTFDGIITIDTHVVEELIKITGPIEVFGTVFSADLDKRCNCPNVIFELENYAQVIERGEADRKAIVGTLMQQILVRAIGASSEKLPDFINIGVNLANEKHIMFYMHDGKTQEALSNLNWTGQIKNFDGDYLHINDTNFAGGKSNLYVKEQVLLEIERKSNSESVHKLTINYSNPQPYNIWLNGINRDYIRVYLPKGAKLISSKGSDEKVTIIDQELNKTVLEAFIQIRPQNSRTLEFEYSMQISLKDKDYPLLIQKQPGTGDFKYVVKIDGRKKAEFDLDSDKELLLPL